MKPYSLFKKGITGFCDDDPELHHVHIDYYDFKAKCYDVARRLRGRVIFIDDIETFVERSFYITRIGDVKDLNVMQSFDILINMYYPVISLSKPRGMENPDIEFIDIPVMSEFFGKDYLVLSKSQLMEEFDYNNEELKDKFYKYEIEQIKYWKPKSFADVIFNYWD